jgi:hypothetical protein
MNRIFYISIVIIAALYGFLFGTVYSEGHPYKKCYRTFSAFMAAYHQERAGM